uniref:Uncharacterized protein n=1 Tax=viral metagenome TaxID=1070528 RepID=A0A6C0JSJ3_9ZZZZ
MNKKIDWDEIFNNESKFQKLLYDIRYNKFSTSEMNVYLKKKHKRDIKEVNRLLKLYIQCEELRSSKKNPFGIQCSVSIPIKWDKLEIYIGVNLNKSSLLEMIKDYPKSYLSIDYGIEDLPKNSFITIKKLLLTQKEKSYQNWNRIYKCLVRLMNKFHKYTLDSEVLFKYFTKLILFMFKQSIKLFKKRMSYKFKSIKGLPPIQCLQLKQIIPSFLPWKERFLKLYNFDTDYIEKGAMVYGICIGSNRDQFLIFESLINIVNSDYKTLNILADPKLSENFKFECKKYNTKIKTLYTFVKPKDKNQQIIIFLSGCVGDLCDEIISDYKNLDNPIILIRKRFGDYKMKKDEIKLKTKRESMIYVLGRI